MKKQLILGISLFAAMALISTMFLRSRAFPWRVFANKQLDDGMRLDKSHPRFLLSQLKYREASMSKTMPASEVICVSFVVHRNKSGASGCYMHIYYYGYSLASKLALTDETTGSVILPAFDVVPNSLDVDGAGSVSHVNFSLREEEGLRVCNALTSAGLRLAIHLKECELNHLFKLSNNPLLDNNFTGAEEYIYFPQRWNAQLLESFPRYRYKKMGASRISGE